MEKIITVGGKEMRMRASALIPRLYRHKFGRDVVADMNRLIGNYSKVTSDENRQEMLDVIDLEIFENIAWLFMKHAGEDVGESPDEWLESFDGIFSIYEIMPEVIELWGLDQLQTSQLKNPAGQR